MGNGTILIADATLVSRTVLRTILEAVAPAWSIREAANAQAGVKVADETPPRVAFLAVDLAAEASEEGRFLDALLARAPGARVVLMGEEGEPEALPAALAGEDWARIDKPLTEEDVLAQMRAMASV